MIQRAASRFVLGTFLVLMMAGVCGFIVAPFASRRATAAQLTPRLLELSTSAAGASNVTYAVSFTLATAGAIGSISIQICSNSPLLLDPCTAPSGFDASGAVPASQSGVSGFTISSHSTANDIILTRPSTVAAAVPATYTFTGITNPAAAGSYYGRISTYASSDASGPDTDEGGLAFALNAAIDVNATVPPFLLFCSGNTISAFDCSTASGSYLDLGDFSAAHPSGGTSQLLAASNAQGGYSVSVSGTPLESGNNVLPALADPAPSQAGVSEFGINLRANTNPALGANPSGPGKGVAINGYNLPNQFKYRSGDVIAHVVKSDDFRKYTVSYLVNIAHGQPVGVYASTFTYLALANF